MCNYQHGTIKCRGDGYLWDADGYDPGDMLHPCPKCNMVAFLANAKEQAETTVSGSFGVGCSAVSYTGSDFWIGPRDEAYRIDPEQAAIVEASLCPIHALVPDNNKGGYAVKIITARAQ
jgi:hypothetical protein